jgi:hypothetical protein
MTRAFLLFLLLLPGLAAWGQSTGIRGKVVNADGEPLAGAVVFIPELKAGAYANEQGIYALSKLTAGRYEIWCYFFGYDTLRQEVEVVAGETRNLGFVLQERSIYTDEVEILSERTGEIKKSVVNVGVTGVTPKEISLIPTVGAPDLAQYLQVLPGVVFTGDQGGQLYIRGGTPIMNMVLLDDMILYSPFHSIGLFSVVDPDYLRNVDVYSAAFPGQYGGRISSVIDIKSRSGSLSQFRGKLNVNPFTAGALLEGPIVKGKEGGGMSFLLSARNNYIDRTATTFYPYINEGEGLPYNFLDLYGKLSLSDGINSANLFGFRHTDNVNFEFPANIGWNSAGGGGNFQLLPSGSGAIISGSFAYSDYFSTLKSGSENFPRRSSIQGFNGNLRVGYLLRQADELNFGMSLLGFTTDYVFTNSSGLQTRQEASNTEAAIHFRYKYVLNSGDFQRAVLEPSLHMHYYNNQAAVRLEPRLRAKLNFPGLSFSAGLGSYSQNLLPAVSDRDVVNLFQGFLSAPEDLAYQIKTNTLQTAWHALAGVEAELIPNLSSAVEVWNKTFTQVTTINREKLFPGDPDFVTETGRAYGLDLILKYRTRSVYLYANYGWAQNTRTDRIQTDNPRTYPPVWDRRHTANFVFAYQRGRVNEDLGPGRRSRFSDSKWEFSLRWSLGSGFPFTQTQGYFEKLDFQEDGAQTPIAFQNGELALILADELNGGRLPYYHRLDLSATRRWLILGSILAELNLAVINAYDRDNIFYFDRIRYAPVYQFPVLPSAGLTLRF